MWAEVVVATCVCVKPGEVFLALTDEPLRRAGEALCAAAAACGALRVSHLVLPPPRRGSLVAVSGSLLRQVEGAEAIVSLTAAANLGREDAVLRAAVAAFRQSGRGRWALGSCLDPGRLDEELVADSAQVTSVTAAVAGALSGGSEVRLTTPAGSDLRMRLGPRPIHQETGVYDRPGALGNLPAGEVYTAPLEESAEGLLVVDLSLGDIPLDSPVFLHFRNGRVTKVDGGKAAAELGVRLGNARWGWTVGELGIGANAAIRPRGVAAIDEKALGTAHVALGGNRGFGGANPAATHYDCVVREPAIYVDGRLLR